MGTNAAPITMKTLTICRKSELQSSAVPWQSRQAKIVMYVREGLPRQAIVEACRLVAPAE